MRRGFTLLELLVVISVIAVLTGASLAAFPIIKRRAMISNTQAAVRAVATAITSYGAEMITLRDGVTGVDHGYRAWNWNQPAGDDILDGHPQADEPGISASGHLHYRLFAAGYLGFADTVRPELPNNYVDADGHVVDAWKHPLRLWWSSTLYGSAGFGVASDGPDGLKGTADDLTSWGRK